MRHVSRETGRDWYNKYKTEGAEGFRRYKLPMPFDFDAADAKIREQRTRCFFDVGIEDEEVGRVEMELVNELLPVTCANFELLCSGKAPSGFKYEGSSFIHRVVRGVSFMGGWMDTPGRSHSAFKNQRYFADEGFFIPHATEGIISMANAGVDTNASQFYITLEPCPHMDGRTVAFGRISKGFDVIKRVIQDVYTRKGRPVKKINILRAGVLNENHSLIASHQIITNTPPPVRHEELPPEDDDDDLASSSEGTEKDPPGLSSLEQDKATTASTPPST